MGCIRESCDVPVCRPSQQRGLQRQRPPSRLSREVSAEEAFMLAHASECIAEVARQPAIGSLLHAACEKLHDEQRAAQMAAILHSCSVPSSHNGCRGDHGQRLAFIREATGGASQTCPFLRERS